MARTGFTTIELLAATVLSAMLISAVLGVVGGLSRQEKILMRRRPAEPWQVQLRHRLHWDLAQSQSYAFDGKSLTLTGLSSRDFASGRPTYQQAMIQYTLRENSLLRTERQLEALDNANMKSELVLTGARRIVFNRTEEPQEGPVPDRASISLWGPDNQIVFAHAFVIR